MVRRFRRPLIAVSAVAAATTVLTTIGPASAAPGAVAVPTGLTIAATKAGLALFWRANGAKTFQITQAQDQAFTTDPVTYTTTNGYPQFSPPDLTPGTTYYFKVRAKGAAGTSPYTGVVQAAAVTAMQQIRVMTYNILETTADGKHEGGTTIAPWSRRRPAVARMIKNNAPDVVAVEEAWPWIGSVSNRVRQVDSLKNALGAPWKIAPTEPVYPQRHWFRTGDYILYNSHHWTLGTRRGYIRIGDKKYGAYTVLINLSTGAHVLFFATHLIPGNSVSLENTRRKETNTLFAKGATIAKGSTQRFPLIYAGDFNQATPTDPHFTTDATHPGALTYGNDDAFFTAQTLVNAQYDSANLDHRTPPRSADRIDRVFTGPGVAALTAGIELNPSSGPVPSDHNPVWADLEFPYPTN